MMPPAHDGLMVRLIADKRKLSFALALLSVAILLWGRVLFKKVPRTAVATDPAKLAAVNPGETGGDKTGVNDGIKMVYVDFPAGVRRDPFALNSARFIQYEDLAHNPKSDPDPDDDSLGNPSPLSGMALQSTILGQRPRAVINGRIVAAGQQVDGFMVRRILPREVVVERQGVEHRLTISARD